VEGFTILSILANPHFPLAVGLMLLIFLLALEIPNTVLHRAPQRENSRRRSAVSIVGSAALGLLLAMIQPFAVPIVLIVLSVYLVLLGWSERRLPQGPLLITLSAAIGAAPVMLYDLYVYRTNPALAAWSAQNLTPSLPPWSYALGYGLVLLLALAGIWVTLRRRTGDDLFLLSWVGSVVVLLYIPFALQRRFITGFHVPLVLLATTGLQQIIWPRLRPRRQTLFTGLVIGLTALSSLFVPLVSVVGVVQGQFPLVMTQEEFDAYIWLRDNTTWTDTVLAPTELGVFVPAWAGNRVVYGHPFETIEAEQKEAEVKRFYDAGTTLDERITLLDRYDVRYVLVPDPQLDIEALGMVEVWSQENVTLYRVENQP
jgi:hypothetical protein